MPSSKKLVTRMADSYGIEVERRRREIAAHHGVPAFVSRPLDIEKGTGKQREVGDFLVWAGDTVVIVSSKSRAPDAITQETQDRRQRWLASSIASAKDQIKGVYRTLRAAPRDQIALESERGVRVPWDPAMVANYLGVVVVEAAPTTDDYAPPVMNDSLPVLIERGVQQTGTTSTWCSPRRER